MSRPKFNLRDFSPDDLRRLGREVQTVLAEIADRAEPEKSPITGRTRDHLGGGAYTGPVVLLGAVATHSAILAIILLGLFSSPQVMEDSPFDLPGLVFVATEGPGGGGGGGGDESEEAPAPLQLSGQDLAQVAIAALPQPEDLIFDDPDIPNPEPEEELEDAVLAPFVSAMPDPEDLAGLIRDANDALFNRQAGSGRGGGGGTGEGGGIGEGSGDGVGEGTGGGFGGGAYRIGSGVEPPQLRQEITPEYTDDALSRKIEGTVVLEVVILRSGRIGPARILKSLDPGLDEKAIAAVRKWTFLPGRFRGNPVDVIAEIEVEFRLL